MAECTLVKRVHSSYRGHPDAVPFRLQPAFEQNRRQLVMVYPPTKIEDIDMMQTAWLLLVQPFFRVPFDLNLLSSPNLPSDKRPILRSFGAEARGWTQKWMAWR